MATEKEIETAEYDGVVYEVRSIAEGEFRQSGSASIRKDAGISVGDEIFFIDPRSHPESELHMTVCHIQSIESGGIRLKESRDGTGYIACCHHRIVKHLDECTEEDFLSVFE